MARKGAAGKSSFGTLVSCRQRMSGLCLRTSCSTIGMRSRTELIFQVVTEKLMRQALSRFHERALEQRRTGGNRAACKSLRRSTEKPQSMMPKTVSGFRTTSCFSSLI
ncbi:hypothetical protein RHECNPAF_4460045 [Rhizobium etli CNPAF512]|nr:hypothetical protein RHECNPAF_4460045 [Rhizobium etli CNPAF512]